MKNLKSLSRKELKGIKGAASGSKCPPLTYYCPEADVCVAINAECYVIVPEPVEG
ncbi:hypothetical protein [uncultured Chryseobacterium sp.]|jgi:hypothetical protein|uniref:bacteriocin-like protein n=1 Tax=uncultured Chryseobacterium sp. TaxID=259322 RepID=UPI0025F96438|nr:hypothetical protein [uncultured Chryseobacterium sp.]